MPGVTVGIVALPEIGADLGLPDSQLRLVVSLSAVLYGSLLLTAGRVADVVDKRLVFAVGMALTLTGAVCWLVPCAGWVGSGAAAGAGCAGTRWSGRDPGRVVAAHLQLNRPSFRSRWVLAAVAGEVIMVARRGAGQWRRARRSTGSCRRSDEARADQDAYVRGEISIDELIARAKAQYGD